MRKRYLTGALVLLVVGGLSGVAFAGNTSTVIQEGSIIEAAITQTGDLNVATVTQDNPYGEIIARAVVIQDNSASLSPVVGNTAIIKQYVEGDAYIRQVGDGNYAYQNLDYGSEASIRQEGTNNSITQTQNIGYNDALAQQTGNNNSITQTQTGDGHWSQVTQEGDGNVAVVTQQVTQPI